MDLAKYSNLPESLTPNQTRLLFAELMNYKVQNSDDALGLAKALDELADRHWHTYTVLDDTTRNQVDEWVIKNWDRSSLEKVRALICVIGKLGLVASFAMLRREINAPMPRPIRKEIEAAIHEFGTTVKDPYAGMKKSSQ